MQETHEQDRQGLVEIDHAPDPGVVEDVVRLARVLLDHNCVVDPRQQLPAVSDHDRVVVRVHHARLGSDSVRDFVHIALRGKPGADVEELTDAGFGKKVHSATQKCPVFPRYERCIRDDGAQLVDKRAVDCVIVLAPERIVVDPRCMGFAHLDAGWRPAPIDHRTSPRRRSPYRLHSPCSNVRSACPASVAQLIRLSKSPFLAPRMSASTSAPPVDDAVNR